MPITPKGKKILKAMESEYGAKKGKSVFYASANAGKITGVHHSPDRYDDTATNETPPRKEYHSAQEQATAKYPSATGTPDVQTHDPAASPRVTPKTLQAGHASTPSGTKHWPDVQSYEDSEV